MRRILIIAVLACLTAAGLGQAAEPQAATCAGSFVDLHEKTGYHPPATGDIVGITVVVDFADYTHPNYITNLSDIDDFLNEPGYANRGNNGSVRDYFADVSCGALHYTNTLVMQQFTAPQAYSYYVNAPFGTADLLAASVVQWLDASGFDFSGYDANGDGYVDAINILTEGGFIPTKALHPHFSAGINVPVDGLMAGYYQMTNLGGGPMLGVFCHENGHMLCGWGDLYDAPYLYGPWGNVGSLCLMKSAPAQQNPPHPNGFFKILAGWAQPVILDHAQDCTSRYAGCEVFQVPHPDPTQTEESYVVEFRRAVGRDTWALQTGLAIYHITQSPLGHPFIELVEADANGNPHDTTNLWGAPDHDRFSFSTTPPAIWSDGTVPTFQLGNISAPTTEMTWKFGILRTATVAISAKPTTVEPDWTLTGPDDFVREGKGSATFDVPAVGAYTVTWHDIPYWAPPSVVSRTENIRTAGAVVRFETTYTPPMALNAKGSIGDAGGATTVSAVDYDRDGDEDLFVGTGGGRNLLLRNNGSGAFVADESLAVLVRADGVRRAAWGDMDNDGDLDVFLVRGDGENVVLQRTATGMVDVTAATPAFLALSDVTSASWSDVNRDGNLDLFITRFMAVDQLYYGAGNGSFTLGSIGLAANTFRSSGSTWGDYNGDGFSDLLILSGPAGTTTGSSRIFRNDAGVLNWLTPTLTLPAIRDARWADIDTDGRIDLVYRTAHGYLAFKLGTQSGYFETGSPDGGWAQSNGAFALVDLDNDGDLDIYAANDGPEDMVYMNENTSEPMTPEGRRLHFTAVPIGHTAATGRSVAVTSLDADNNGALDLMVVKDGEPNFLLVNRFANRGHWLKLRLASTSQNRGAVGARVELHVGERVLSREILGGGGPGQEAATVHFGVGDATTVDTIIIWWGSDSLPTVLTNVPVNQTLQVEEGDGAKAQDEVAPTYRTEVLGTYPNPFNPSTTLAFTMAEASPVTVAVYGVDGRRVALLQQGVLPAGSHSVVWQGSDDSGNRVSSGCYFWRTTIAGQTTTTKMTLVK